METEVFLDALASLVLIIDTDQLTNKLADWKLTVPQITHIPQISSLKMECHSKWNVTKNGMSLKKECHSKWNVTKNGISLKIECHPKWNVTQNGMSLKIECQSKLNGTLNEMSFQMKCHFK